MSFNWVGRLSAMASLFRLQGVQVVKLAILAVVELGIVPTELSAVEQQYVTWYILREWIHFLLKPACLMASGICWEFSAVFFLLFSLHLFPLLLYVPGLHTTLWTDYSSSGLITVNEGPKQGNSCLIPAYERQWFAPLLTSLLGNSTVSELSYNGFIFGSDI